MGRGGFDLGGRRGDGGVGEREGLSVYDLVAVNVCDFSLL